MEGEEKKITQTKPSEKEEKKRGVMSFVWEVIRFVFLALIIVVPIRIYIAQPYIVSGTSMEPTFETGNYLIVDQLSYRLADPERGDIIIFRYPLKTSKFLIKRIIGLPGETLRMDVGSLAVTSAGTDEFIKIEEPYVEKMALNTFSMTLSDDEYFVMGDNRRASLDSRVWGPLERKYIVGRALVRLLPLTQIEVLPGKHSL